MNQKWIQFHDAADAAGLTGLYASDGILCPPHTAMPVVGPSAIRGFYDTLLIDPAKGLSMQVTEAREIGNMIIEAGTWREDVQGQRVEGLFVTVFLKHGDEWKIAADTWNVSK